MRQQLSLKDGSHVLTRFVRGGDCALRGGSSLTIALSEIRFAVCGDEGNMKVDYNSLTGYLIAAVKDLSQKVDEQAELINELKM